MKKVLSAVLAGAMVASMSVVAFAAPAVAGTVYNADGEKISNPKTGDVYADSVTAPFLAKGGIKYSIDGVLPGITMYIPLGAEMSSKVDTDVTPSDSQIVAGLVTAKKVTAKDVDDLVDNPTADKVLKKDLKTAIEVTEAGKAPTDAYVEDGQCFTLDDSLTDPDIKAVTDQLAENNKVSLTNLTDKDLFKFDYDKEDGSKYVKKISVVDDKKMGKLDRTAYLKIELNESQTVDDLKSTGTVSFKAKKSSDEAKKTSDTEEWEADQEYEIDYTFWINNNKASNDDNIETGDRVYFDPDSNEDNTLVWGDDRAALFFEGNDDASKFYARLQTKADSEIYATYGDPVNADLWFYDFVGNPTVPSTSRATLTLGIPWDEDDDYTPRAEDCYIYEMDADGYLTDVTDRFTYDEENDGTTEIDGWTIKTRTLGTYVISDTELDVTVVDEVEEVEEDVTAPAEDDAKEIPNTGSSDMVGAAVVAAIASLAAAGAVAFKKASK